MCNVVLLMLAGKNSHAAAQVRGKKTESGDPQEMQRHILFVRAAHSDTFCIGTCQAVHRREPGHLMHGFLL